LIVAASGPRQDDLLAAGGGDVLALALRTDTPVAPHP